MALNSQADTSEELVRVERDPSGQYVRYDEIIGRGASKTVYSGFDEILGKEIAWSKVQYTSGYEEYVETLCREARLLESLDHENIMMCYKYWIDTEKETINMITELLPSGNLIDYIKKYNSVVKITAIKKWCRQILEALHYLHNRRHPIIHRDVKCENIFINGNTGEVKLGDFGLAMILGQDERTFSGTAEFIATEIPGLRYDQLVDIYSFGMSVLQMVTRETPYKECNNNDQILRKVQSRQMPVALSEMTDTEVKNFIEKCLVTASQRPSARELLNDPFLIDAVHDQPEEIVKRFEGEHKKFELKAKMKGNVSISMNLKTIGHNPLETKSISFEYLLETDAVQSVIRDMATELEMSPADIALVSPIMEQLISDLKP